MQGHFIAAVGHIEPERIDARALRLVNGIEFGTQYVFTGSIGYTGAPLHYKWLAAYISPAAGTVGLFGQPYIACKAIYIKALIPQAYMDVGKRQQLVGKRGGYQFKMNIRHIRQRIAATQALRFQYIISVSERNIHNRYSFHRAGYAQAPAIQPHR